MNINLHLINASGTLNPFVIDIEKIFPTTIKRIRKVLPVDNVDIIVWEDADWAIKKYGLGGHTIKANTVIVSIDPNNPKAKQSFPERFTTTLMHELHHATRMQALGEGFIPRLEASVREGLAEHFEIQLTGKKPEVWDNALTKQQLTEFIKIAKENKSTEDYYLYDWLFGNKEQKIPEWTGYSVGFQLINDYLETHPQATPATLYKTKAEVFIK